MLSLLLPTASPHIPPPFPISYPNPYHAPVMPLYLPAI